MTDWEKVANDLYDALVMFDEDPYSRNAKEAWNEALRDNTTVECRDHGAACPNLRTLAAEKLTLVK